MPTKEALEKAIDFLEEEYMEASVQWVADVTEQLIKLYNTLYSEERESAWVK